MVDLIPSEKQFTEAEAALKDVGNSYEETFGFHDDDVKYAFKSGKGLTRELVQQISEMKHEPDWMTQLRLKGIRHFYQQTNAQWGAAES